MFVLDDFHLITAPAVLDSVGLLLRRLPPGLRLALVTRSDPPLPLARLRASGQLAELRSADLRFTLEETAAFLAEIAGVDVPASAVAQLHERTEGWAAGQARSALASGKPGPRRLRVDLLRKPSLRDGLSDRGSAGPADGGCRQLPAGDVRAGKTLWSVCDAVTGRTDGHETLERLDAAGLFLIPLDEERQWWRYHQLFDLLRVRLQARGERVPDLHRAAATGTKPTGSPTKPCGMPRQPVRWRGRPGSSS